MGSRTDECGRNAGIRQDLARGCRESLCGARAIQATCRTICSGISRQSAGGRGWRYTCAQSRGKPNAYRDFSQQSPIVDPHLLADAIREWLSFVPEKVLFATDEYPFSDELSWQESGVIAAWRGREDLGIAVTLMMRKGKISRAGKMARMVLRDNARNLYGLP